ncbi:MAG TPA: hypothetical protein VGG64_18120 [Pirellulales bacterium]|jgi:uncharacterized repeat protein (TIGR01451 family)
MSSKIRLLAILTALSLSAPVARAQYQDNNDEDEGTFPKRLEQFGRSLVGGYRSNNRPPAQQRQTRAPTQPQQTNDPYYDTAFGDDDVAPRSAPPSNGQQAMRRGQQNSPPQSSSPQRKASDASVSNAPPLAASTGRSTPRASAATGRPSDASSSPRLARSASPGRADLDSPAAEPVSTPSDASVVRGASASISVETIGPRKISVGKEAKYKLVLKNSGAVSARDVVVTVVLPDFAEVVNSKGSTGDTEPAASGDGLCWKLGMLAAQGREELTLDIVPRKSQPFELGVRWTQAPVASQTTVEVQEPKLALVLDGTKEVAYGEKAVYKLLLSNPGNGDAESVVITLMPLNPGDGPPVSHPIGVVRAGESKTIEVELVARQAGQVTIHAEAKASGDVTATLDQAVVVRRAALAISMHAPKKQYAGTQATYEMHVKNAGNAPAQNLRVKCRLPRGAEFVSCSSSGHRDEGDESIHWTIGSLEANADLTLSVVCSLRTPGVNQVEINCTADREVQQAASAKTQVEAVADLAMEVVDPSGPVLVGTDMVYEIHIRNRGSKSAESIDVVTYFSNGVEPVSVEGGPHELKPGMVVLRTIPALEMGREVVYKIKARADIAGRHRFRAELSCNPLDTKLTEEETTLFYSEATETSETAQ